MVAAPHTDKSGTHVHYGTPAPEEDRQPLDAFFKPRTVAVIGASDRSGSVGRIVFRNLTSTPFGGTVYPINPHRRNVLGIRAYPRIEELPEPVDLAVIITPAATVPSVIEQCVVCGVQAVVILSAGFHETGEPGRALEAQILEKARGNLRVIGPNSLGIMNPVLGLNAAYSSHIAQKGTVAFLSQSGALGAAILDWSQQVNVGFSAFVSFGSMLDVGWHDLLSYFGRDPNTKSIVMYLQSIGDVRAFLSASREVALKKPLILLKAGQTREGAEAARTTSYYSESESYDDAVLSAALRRCGVLRVEDVDSLFSFAELLAKQPRPQGKRLTIMSNAAAPNILATDALARGGGKLAQLSDDTLTALNALLPTYWNHTNPIDLVANADAARYASAIEIVAKDDNSDGLLVALTPQVLSDPTGTAQAISDLGDLGKKPILASWMGGAGVAAGEAILDSHNIPTFPYPDAAARAFNAMWRYSYNLKSLYETPTLQPWSHEASSGLKHVTDLIDAAVQEERDELAAEEVRKLLALYGIEMRISRKATSAAEAIERAKAIGYPIELQFRPPNETRSAGGVVLNVPYDEAIGEAYEQLHRYHDNTFPGHPFGGVFVQPLIPAHGQPLVVGSRIDPRFGPVLYFGAQALHGGNLEDQAVALPPLNSTLARRMMEQTRVYDNMYQAAPTTGIDLEALEQVLVRFSQLVVEQHWIREIVLNPLLVARDRIVVLEARVFLHPATTDLNALPKLAIRPYPNEYVYEEMLKTGIKIILRPIRPEDEALMVPFHESLSEQTVYYRYLRRQSLDMRIDHARLTQRCFIDYDRQITLVADWLQEETGQHRILATASLVKMDAQKADFALVVSDAWQGQGLGRALLGKLITVGRAEGIQQLTGTIHPDNRAMLQLCTKLGFTLEKPLGDEVVASLPL